MVMIPPIGIGGNVENGSAQGQLYYWDDTAKELKPTGVTEAFWDSTNKRLGIGISSPNAPLEILNSSGSQLRLTHTDGVHYGELKANSSGDIQVEPSGDYFDFLKNMYLRGGKYMRIGSYTNIWEPSHQLGGVTYIGRYGFTATYNTYWDDTDSRWEAIAGGSQCAFGMGEGKFSFVYGTASGADTPITWTDRLSILADGKVGINTTSPGRILDVLDDSNPQIRGSHTDGTHYFELQADGSGYMKMITSGGGYGIDVAPTAVQTGYTTPSNLTTDRTFDADSTTVAELADVLGTLIEDLKAKGIVSA